MRVAKFGGTSAASAQQFRKIAGVLERYPDIKFAVVSAPGERFTGDSRVTGLLVKSLEDPGALEEAIDRCVQIERDLGLEQYRLGIPELFHDQYRQRNGLTEAERLDAVKSCGENASALLLWAYLDSLGVRATYLDATEIVPVEGRPGQGRIQPQLADRLRPYADEQGMFVLGGFYGSNSQGKRVTLHFGGSDTTGGYVAQAVGAEEYLNCTNVDGISPVDPRILRTPPIAEVTFDEIGELAYNGFKVIDYRSLEPVYRAGIPVRVMNTDNPDAPGTRIVAARAAAQRPVIGISSSEDYYSITMKKFGMRDEVGFIERLARIFEKEGLSCDYFPAGLNYLSVILRDSQLDDTLKRRIASQIHSRLRVDTLAEDNDLAIVTLVGDGIPRIPYVTQQATAVLQRAGINPRPVDYPGGLSLMVGVRKQEMAPAVRALYREFF